MNCLNFNTHSLAGVIRIRNQRIYYCPFQYALPCGSDSEAFTKSGIKKSYKFCQIAKCSTFIITDLWNITILLSLIYKIPVGKPLRTHRFFQVENGRFPQIRYGGTRYWAITIPLFFISDNMVFLLFLPFHYYSILICIHNKTILYKKKQSFNYV